LHGYQHKYVTCHPGIVTRRKKSEFAGVPASEQEDKIRRAMGVFLQHGIKSQLWIAPNNSFDATTVALLPRFGISMICDGHFRFPFVCRRNLLWLPHQIFGFRPAPAGVWTVCYHHNRWTFADLQRFLDDLDNYGTLISCLDDVARAWAGHRSWRSSVVCFSPRLSPLLIRGQLKMVSWWRSPMPKIRAQPQVATISDLQAVE
jgi:hypothetical protein